ncbi:MAG TPA: fumarylacetoacetate hydrolase family protein [Amycolatopsis sp.]|nr:fumarylacetoacetate hydrolase family protein [Amycolatopsis sp.]
MRWVTYRTTADPLPRAGIVDDAGEQVAAPYVGRPLASLLAEGHESLAKAGRRAEEDPVERVAMADVSLLAPIPEPPSIRDFMAFEEHVVTSLGALGQEIDPVWYMQPVFYFSNPAAILGPHDDVTIAPGSRQFDYELEVCAVIGRPGSDLDPDTAVNHIAGYTVFCDWSARDLQAAEMRVGLGPAKGKDTATSLGPFLVTPDELEDRARGQGFDLAMTARVNGVQYSSGRWSDLHWSFAEMVAHASRGTRVRAGDVIGAGTVGTGCILELARVHGESAFPYLRAGDVVELEVERLGVIRSTVRART